MRGVLREELRVLWDEGKERGVMGGNKNYSPLPLSFLPLSSSCLLPFYQSMREGTPGRNFAPLEASLYPVGC